MGEPTAEVLEMCPVVSVEALANLGAHVGQEKGLVHGFLAPFRISGRDLVTAVISGAEVVLQLASKLLWDSWIFHEDRVFPVPVRDCKRGGRDVLGHPRWVSQASVVGRDESRSSRKIGDGAREAILKEAAGIDRRDCAFRL